MNGIHDMGGMHGMGKVEVEADDALARLGGWIRDRLT